MKFSKESSFGPNGNFAMIVAQHQVHFNLIFFLILQHGRAQEVEKKNPVLGLMGNFDPIVAQNHVNLYLRIYFKNLFQTL